MLSSRLFPETQLSLLSRIRRGSDSVRLQGWRDFFECYAPAVYRLARRRGLTDSDAEDIVQQVLMSVAHHISEFRYDRDRGRFRQWIRRVTANKIHDHFRQYQAREGRITHERIDVSEIELTDDNDDAWQREWHLQDLSYCLERVRGEISAKRYQAFKMYVIEGLSAQETAEALGMTLNHVYVTRTMVIQRLQHLIRELNDTGNAISS